jgi:hypothetical protein
MPTDPTGSPALTAQAVQSAAFIPKKNKPPTYYKNHPGIAHMSSYVYGQPDDHAFSIAITYLSGTPLLVHCQSDGGDRRQVPHGCYGAESSLLFVYVVKELMLIESILLATVLVYSAALLSNHASVSHKPRD